MKNSNIWLLVHILVRLKYKFGINKFGIAAGHIYQKVLPFSSENQLFWDFMHSCRNRKQREMFRQSFRIYLELFPTCSRKYNIMTIKWMNELPFELSNDLFLTSCQITQDLKKLENFRKESKSSSLLAIQNKNFYNFARNMPKSSIKRSIESAILPNF